jgi:hypothetical protein
VESRKGITETAATPKITLRLVFEPPRRDLTLPLKGEFNPIDILFLTKNTGIANAISVNYFSVMPLLVIFKSTASPRSEMVRVLLASPVLHSFGSVDTSERATNLSCRDVPAIPRLVEKTRKPLPLFRIAVAVGPNDEILKYEELAPATSRVLFSSLPEVFAILASKDEIDDVAQISNTPEFET